jgi:hypothetical protein
MSPDGEETKEGTAEEDESTDDRVFICLGKTVDG